MFPSWIIHCWAWIFFLSLDLLIMWNHWHVDFTIIPKLASSQLRGRLLDEFQPGLKFQHRKGAGILLRLHDEFQPRLKYKPPSCFIENIITAHAQAHFPHRPYPVWPGWISVWTENRQLHFKRICFWKPGWNLSPPNWAESSEICHVIGPSVPFLAIIV